MATKKIDVQVIIDAVDNASKQFQSLGSSLDSVGNKLTLLGAAGTAALGLSVKSAIDFESAFAGVRKTVDASEAEFQAISDNFRQIAKETPVAATELSKIGELAGQLGVRGVDNITKFAKTVADIGVSTNLTTEQAATDFARLANIMGEPITNVDRIGSSIVDLGNNFATTEVEISNFAQRIAGAGKIAGLTTDQVLAIGAAMSSVGVEAEAGGTSVQKVLNKMTEAVATGNEDLQQFAATAGMTADEFSTRFRDNAGGAFTDFVQGLGKEGDKAFATLDELGLSNERVIRAFLSLANAGDILEESLGTSSAAWEENTALLTEAEKRYATTESQLQILRNNLNDVGITIGSALLPAINDLVAALVPMIEKFADFAEKHPKIVSGVLLVSAGISGLGLALKGAGIIMSGFAPIIGGLGKAFTFLSGIKYASIGAKIVGMLGTIKTAIGGVTAFLMANPVFLIIGAIVAAIAFLALAWKNNWFDIQGKTAAAVEFLGQKFEQFKTWASETWTALVEGFNTFKTNLATAWENLKLTISNGITAVITAFQNFVNFLINLPTLAQEALGMLGQFLWDLFTFQIPMALGFAYQSFINFFTVQIPELWTAFVTFMTEQVPLFIEQFVMWWDSMKMRVAQMLLTLFTVTIPGAIAAFVAYVSSAIPNMVAAVISWFQNLYSSAVATWEALKANTIAQFEAMKQQAIQKATELYNNVRNWIQNTLDTVRSILSNLPGVVAAQFNAAKEQAISIAKSLYDGVKGWIDKVISLFNKVISKASEAISKAREAFSIGRDKARQFGGPVGVGQSYLVGERGPELFVPPQNGRIVPNNQLQGSGNGGGGSTIQFFINADNIVNSPTERRSFAEAILNDLKVIAKSQGQTVEQLLATEGAN